MSMMHLSPFQTALVTALSQADFLENSTIRSERVFERAHPNEPKLRVVVNTGIPQYTTSKNFPVSVSAGLYTAYKTYTIASSFTVRPLQDDVVFLTLVFNAIENADQKACLWYDKKNGTSTASSKEIAPVEVRTGGYMKMDCPKTPLDGI